jgi:hypothetical protein
MSAALQQKPEIKIKLTAVAGPHSGQVFLLNKSSITLGRGPENDIVLLNDPQVSRSHAQLSVMERDLEVVNLSQKSYIVVQGESVQKWKIVNNSNFTIGDTEFNVEYDLGQAVVSVVPPKPVAQVVQLKPKIKAPTGIKKPPQKPVAKQKTQLQPVAPPPGSRNPAPAIRQQQMQANNMQNRMPAGLSGQLNVRNAGSSYAQPNYAPSAATKKDDSLMSNPNFKYYILILIIIGSSVSYFTQSSRAAKAKKISSILKYEDTVNAQINSQAEKAKEQDLDVRRKEKNSAQLARIDENFIKGMRDFQLGNYTRAQEFFQLVLNLDPDHQLAKRHLYLCKVRFDELVQEKLMLGETYFKKHNFRMCESMYQQVVDMLEGKNDDQKNKLAQIKAKECELAAEGIR